VAGTLAAIADPALRAAFREWLLRTADDELVMGHRHSEWTGFGPDIESDVAMSSIAQEEIGHARAFYEQATVDEGGDVDRLAFGRPSTEFHHGILLERENDGWEFSIVRLALYEAFETARLRALGACGQEPVAGLARTVEREERYHGLFAETWLTRLTRATDEGHRRVQAALEAAWPDALGLFEVTAADELLRTRGILPQSPATQRGQWEEVVRPMLEGLDLVVPAASPREGGRKGRHTPEFDKMLAQMTEVWRSDPEARW
jgi:ring-1,2-phenylacetyl-CoA epoxidase subunit PaaC